MALEGENVRAMGSEEEILRADGVKGVKIKAEIVRVKRGVGVKREENKSGGLKRNKEC